MPQILTLRLFRYFPLYVAWDENDYHERGKHRFGFSETHAVDRCFAALD